MPWGAIEGGRGATWPRNVGKLCKIYCVTSKIACFVQLLDYLVRFLAIFWDEYQNIETTFNVLSLAHMLKQEILLN